MKNYLNYVAAIFLVACAGSGYAQETERHEQPATATAETSSSSNSEQIARDQEKLESIASKIEEILAESGLEYGLESVTLQSTQSFSKGCGMRCTEWECIPYVRCFPGGPEGRTTCAEGCRITCTGMSPNPCPDDN